MKKRASELRRIAWHIKHDRAYLHFDGNSPRFEWPTDRGCIPKRLWRNQVWRHTHIVGPVVRERLKWDKIRRNGPYALPDSLKDEP